MTDPDLMEADCVHGVTWYECKACAAMDPGQGHPGALLKEELHERGWSQADLARATGLTQKHVSQIITGKCGIGQTAAAALEDALGISARLWIRLQADYDVTHGRNRM